MLAVVFDLFGTLIPNLTRESFDACSRRVAEHLHAPLPELLDELQRQFPLRMNGEIPDGPEQFRLLADTLDLRVSTVGLRRAAAEWRAWLASGMVPKPDAVHVLGALRERGLRLALASDASTSTRDEFDASPLGDFFEVRAISAHVGFAKPHPAMYRHVLDGLGVAGDRCIYVGDGNSNELSGAKRHDMTTVWVDNGAEQHWKVDFEPGGDHTVRELTEVLDLVDELRG